MAPQIEAVVSPRDSRRPETTAATSNRAATANGAPAAPASRISRGHQRRSMSMGSIARAPFGVLSTVAAAVTAGTAGLLFPAAVDSDADAAEDPSISGEAGAGSGLGGEDDDDGNTGDGGSEQAAVADGPTAAGGDDDAEAERSEHGGGTTARAGHFLEKTEPSEVPVVRGTENEENLEEGTGLHETTGAREGRPSAEGEGEGEGGPVVTELGTSVAAPDSLIHTEREDKAKVGGTTRRRENERALPAAAVAAAAAVTSVVEQKSPASATATASPPVTSLRQDRSEVMDAEPRGEENGQQEEEEEEEDPEHEKGVEAAGGGERAGAGSDQVAAATADHSWEATGDLPAASVVIIRSDGGPSAAADVAGNAPETVPVAAADTVADQLALDGEDTESAPSVLEATVTEGVGQPLVVAEAQGESTAEASGGSLPKEEARDVSVPDARATDVDLPLGTTNVSGEYCTMLVQMLRYRAA